MNIFKRIERWLFGPEPEMDPVLAAIMQLPRPSRPAGPTGPIEYAQWETEGGTTPEQNEARVFPAADPRRVFVEQTIRSVMSSGAGGCVAPRSIVVVDDTSDCLTVAAAAAVAAMVIESTPPACPYCETAIPPAPMPSTDTPLEAPSPSSDTPDCGGSSCDCSCGGGDQ
jgi:hypothetical protein